MPEEQRLCHYGDAPDAINITPLFLFRRARRPRIGICLSRTQLRNETPATKVGKFFLNIPSSSCANIRAPGRNELDPVLVAARVILPKVFFQLHGFLCYAARPARRRRDVDFPFRPPPAFF